MKDLFLFFILFYSLTTCGQEAPTKIIDPIFPQAEWQTIEPEKVGFSSKMLKKAKVKFEESGGVAALVIVKGYIVADWGDTKRKIDCRSMRKSLINSLYGIHIKNGNIDIDKSLGEININDRNQLNDMELSTPLKYLLSASSGIYLPAAYEEPAHKNKPDRGTHKPGEHFQYNNWDFNALSTIFKKSTGEDVFEAFENQIAKPLQMEHFSVDDTYYLYQPHLSDHPAYLIWLSTKDLARYGLLYLNEGQWNGNQIVPQNWVVASTQWQTKTGEEYYYDYGYLWWVTKGGTQATRSPFLARGAQSQYMYIDPNNSLIIIFRDNPFGEVKVKKSIAYPLIGDIYKSLLN